MGHGGHERLGVIAEVVDLDSHTRIIEGRILCRNDHLLAVFWKSKTSVPLDNDHGKSLNPLFLAIHSPGC